MKRDKLIRIVVLTTMFFLAPFWVMACDITVSVDGSKKEKYQANDIVTITVEVNLSHRRCPVDINETSIKVSAMQIVGATKWVNTGGSRWERKFRIKIIPGSDTRAILTAIRECNKDGGKGSLVLAV